MKAAAPVWAAGLLGLPAQLTGLDNRLARLLPKSMNSSAIHDAHSLKPVPNAAGQLPAPLGVWFPASLGDLRGGSLTHANANTLLGLYNSVQAQLPNTDVTKAQKITAIYAEIRIRG